MGLQPAQALRYAVHSRPRLRREHSHPHARTTPPPRAQVILKPDPGNSQELYLGSLEALGIDTRAHDVRCGQGRVGGLPAARSMHAG